MDDFKRYLKIMTAVFVAGILVHLGTVIYFDPYRVFGFSGYNQINFEPNTRFLKAEKLINEHDFNAFVVGSSRAGLYDVAILNELSGRNYYNYGVSGASMDGILQRIRWLAQTQNLEQLIITLDYDVMLLENNIGPNDLLRHEHYAVSGENPVSFFYRYLLFQPKAIRRVIKENKRMDRIWYSYDGATGQHALPLQAALLAADPDAYVKNGFDSLGYSINGRSKARYLDELEGVVRELKSAGTDVILVVNPYHHLYMREFDPEDYARWLARLAEMDTELWDFSGFNSITMNDTNFYDPLHFTHEVSAMIISRIFAGAADNIPDDFGYKMF